tara:strand:- start:62 stop:268 length:207 start_codon:yes stop_codon:yes gene_type:complete
MEKLKPDHVSEIIEMSLSDKFSFKDIEAEYALGENDVKKLMRQNLKRGSYRAWRRRVKRFSERREYYK